MLSLLATAPYVVNTRGAANPAVIRRPSAFYGVFDMRKYLLFAAVLLAPNLAYSADLSVQAAPASSDGIACDIGPKYTGAVPAAALAVGFTHCAANYDFSNSFYATRSNWLDCAGAANPQWWNLSFARGAVAPCSRYNVIPDPAFGTNVLQSIYQPSDWPREISTELDTTNSASPTPGSNPGFFFPTQFYVEVAEYVTADTQNNAYAKTSCGSSPALFGGVWAWAAPERVETDFMEFYPGASTCTNGGNTSDHSGGGALFPANVNAQPGQLVFSSGYDPTIPHTYGILQMANGTTYTRCNYMDNVGLGSGCVSDTFGAGAISSQSWLKITIGPEDNNPGTKPSVNEDLRVQRITVWECTDLQNGHC
jgi:hypothetical protein